MNHREYEKMRVAWVANVKIENITLLSLGFCDVVTCHLRESILEDVRDLLLDVLRRKRYNIRSSHHHAALFTYLRPDAARQMIKGLGRVHLLLRSHGDCNTPRSPIYAYTD
jgi:hypothetical protein